MTQKPTAGMIVTYTLNQEDVDRIVHQRSQNPTVSNGNPVAAGYAYPMLIVRVWNVFDNGVNGQVFLDGNDTLWVTSVRRGYSYGTWLEMDEPKFPGAVEEIENTPAKS